MGIAALALALAACGAPSASLWDTAKPTVTAAPEIAPLERKMFERLNRDRRGAGLPALAYDPALADVARAHSRDMQQHDFFSHESPHTGVLEDRMDRAGYLAAEMRENLATAPNVEKAQDNLLKSPGHRRNILADSISHVGIGIVRGDATGDARVLVITQVFARKAELLAPRAAPTAIGKRLTERRAAANLPALASHPMLAELAREHVSDLPDDVASDAVGDIGDAVAQVLNERDDHGLVSVQILAQAVFNAAEFTVPDAIADGRATHVGIAALPARDERGRPRVKVLVLVGRR